MASKSKSITTSSPSVKKNQGGGLLTRIRTADSETNDRHMYVLSWNASDLVMAVALVVTCITLVSYVLAQCTRMKGGSGTPVLVSCGPALSR